jgi:hypothetical protein
MILLIDQNYLESKVKGNRLFLFSDLTYDNQRKTVVHHLSWVSIPPEIYTDYKTVKKVDNDKIKVVQIKIFYEIFYKFNSFSDLRAIIVNSLKILLKLPFLYTN